MIRLVDVEKAYESGAGKTWVLRRINLEIKEGDFITVMGPSGAGKSTLMGIIGMLDGAWKGEYYLLDNPVHKLDNRKRAETDDGVKIPGTDVPLTVVASIDSDGKPVLVVLHGEKDA